MDDLIEALTILRNYRNPLFPTQCEHDTLYVAVDPQKVSDQDKVRLEELGFEPDEGLAVFSSYRFGSF